MKRTLLLVALLLAFTVLVSADEPAQLLETPTPDYSRESTRGCPASAVAIITATILVGVLKWRR